MHGSLAWLECPKCSRIFTDFSREIAADEYSELQCPCCKNINLIAGEDPILRSLIITPTFLKSLDNINIKNIWHNAFIDISEADFLVFIGYSFPDADFEMRCLLKKAVKNSASITVVLNESSNPKKYTDSFESKGYTNEECSYLVNHMCLPGERYKAFFGEDKVTLFYDGFEKYLDKIGGAVNG
jgi:NAD-dependent SIR2 family protein deacetylase